MSSPAHNSNNDSPNNLVQYAGIDRKSDPSSDSALCIIEHAVQISKTPVLVFNPSGDCLWVNQEALDSLGLGSDSTLIDKINLWENCFIAGDPQLNSIEKLIAGQAAEVDNLQFSPGRQSKADSGGSGPDASCPARIFPLFDQCSNLTALYLFVDGTCQKVQEVGKSENGNSHDSALLYSIDVAKRFSRRNSHDFNNIIAVMQGFASILQGRLAEDETNRGMAEQIEESANEAFKITSWHSGFANNNPGEMTELDLNSLVKEFINEAEGTKPQEVQLEVNLGEDLPSVLADEKQMDRICHCLWQNAVEAMSDGGILSWETAVEVKSAPGQGSQREYVRLGVADTGAGIDEAIMESIFDPFFTTKNGKDRGLGLTIVYDAVHAHGGFMEVSSQPGVGTCVNVYLPVHAPSDDGSPSSADPDSVQQARTLLVVDDEPIIHVLVTEILKGQGVEVVNANSGEEAVKIFQDHPDGIKGVILDISLPGMDGQATFGKLRELAPELKVIVSSGDTFQQPVYEMMETGAFGMLAKPFTQEDLIEVVKKLMA